MDNPIVIENATVKDLIDCLLLFPQNKRIVIEDADTGLLITKIHVEEVSNQVELSGRYGEMKNE